MLVADGLVGIWSQGIDDQVMVSGVGPSAKAGAMPICEVSPNWTRNGLLTVWPSFKFMK